MAVNSERTRLGSAALIVAAAVGALTIPASAAAQASNVDWPNVNNTLDGRRYSPLNEINHSTVKQLKVAWQFRARKILGTETYPVIVAHTAYVTTSYGVIYALDAATGKERWSFDPRPLKNGRIGGFLAVAAHGYPNRGVAVADGHVYGVANNALLFALDQTTGRLAWKTSLGDPRFLAESAAPIFYRGMVFVGSTGGETGARGFEAAYDAKTGKLVWRHYTIPPANVSGSWVTGHHGGGDVWMSPTIDAKTGRLYIATGNPGSDLDPRVRPGRNLWTDSILALDPKTGRQIWGYQLEHRDYWDLDSTSPPVLFPTKSGLAIGEANKGGFWHEVAATTGKRLTAPIAFVYQHRVVTKPGATVISWPGVYGGSEWSPVPFSPQTGLVYVSGLNAPSKLTVPKKPAAYSNGLDAGGNVDFSGAWTRKYPLAGTGTFTAIDVNTGRIRWQTKEPVGMIGGATTGRVLWQHALGGRIDDAASVYSVNGKEYVLIASGGSSVSGGGWGGTQTPSPATFTAFALNGN